ncbi:polyprenol monophosphomannose synthase [soil metagenome]
MNSIVLIPTYNERDNLVTLVAEIHKAVPNVDVLIIDDNSPDGTGAIADMLAHDDTRVQVVHRTGKLGLGTAYVVGFRWALARDYERIIQMDADFSHRPDDLPFLLDVAKYADVVIGSRNVAGGGTENWPRKRKLLSMLGSLYGRSLLGLSVTDCTSGFKCFRRRALESLDLDAVQSNGYSFQVEINDLCQRAGLRVVEAPIIFPQRIHGHSKMSNNIMFEALGLFWRLRLQSALTGQSHGTRRNVLAAQASHDGRAD